MQELVLWVLELAPGISLVLAKVVENAVPLLVAMVQGVAVTEW